MEHTLAHTADILELRPVYSRGAAAYDWTVIHEEIPCRLDLAFIRQGKDPGYVQEAGRAADRNGVLFAMPDAPFRPGQRIEIHAPGNPWLDGSRFDLGGAVDLAMTLDELHHIEMAATEVPSPTRNAPGAQ